jgi:hypothetical protein
MAQGLCRFLVQMQGRDGGFSGRIGSRGTSHAFPFGAEHFAARFGDAAALARGFRAGYRADLLTAPSQTDDRYFAYFYFPQFAQAYALAARSRSDPVPAAHSEQSTPEEIHLAESGFRVIRSSGTTLHVSRRLGGAIAVSREGERCAYHLGYEITTEDGRRFVSATWDDEDLLSEQESSVGRFRAVSEGLPLVHLMVPFTIFVRLLAFGGASVRFSEMIKRKLVRPAREIPVSLVRRVERRGVEITIIDELIRGGRIRLARLRPTIDIAMHSPSARFDDPTSIFSAWENNNDWVDTLNREGRLTITSQLRLGSEELETGSAIAPDI